MATATTGPAFKTHPQDDTPQQGLPSKAVMQRTGKLTEEERAKFWDETGRRRPRGSRPEAPTYRFRVVAVKTPSNSLVLEEGDYLEVEAVSETAAIRDAAKLWQLDPRGEGILSNYSFAVEWADETPDPRPRPGGRTVEDVEKMKAYFALKNQQHRVIMF
jgi:hypothetical protein